MPPKKPSNIIPASCVLPPSTKNSCTGCHSASTLTNPLLICSDCTMHFCLSCVNRLFTDTVPLALVDHLKNIAFQWKCHVCSPDVLLPQQLLNLHLIQKETLYSFNVNPATYQSDNPPLSPESEKKRAKSVPVSPAPPARPAEEGMEKDTKSVPLNPSHSSSLPVLPKEEINTSLNISTHASSTITSQPSISTTAKSSSTTITTTSTISSHPISSNIPIVSTSQSSSQSQFIPMFHQMFQQMQQTLSHQLQQSIERKFQTLHLNQDPAYSTEPSHPTHADTTASASTDPPPLPSIPPPSTMIQTPVRINLSDPTIVSHETNNQFVDTEAHHEDSNPQSGHPNPSQPPIASLLPPPTLPPSQNNYLPVLPNLPPIQLLTFSGKDPTEFPLFYEQFVELVHNRPMTNTERMGRLVGSLREPALSRVRAVGERGEDYPLAMEALLKKYGYTLHSPTALWKDIEQHPDISQDLSNIEGFVTLLRNRIHRLQKINIPTIVIDQNTEKVWRKIPEKFQHQILISEANHNPQVRPETISMERLLAHLEFLEHSIQPIIFANAMKKRNQSHNNNYKQHANHQNNNNHQYPKQQSYPSSSVQFVNQHDQPKKQKRHKPNNNNNQYNNNNNYHHQSSSRTNSINNNNNNNNNITQIKRTDYCRLCSSKNHVAVGCGVYPTAEERYKYVKEKSLCVICLHDTHKTSDCYYKERSCWKCGKRYHHVSLCRLPPPTNQFSNISTPTASIQTQSSSSVEITQDESDPK